MNLTIRLHSHRVFHAQCANPLLAALLGLGVACLSPVASAQGYHYTQSITDGFGFNANSDSRGITFDSSGNLFVTDEGNSRIVERPIGGSFSSFGSAGNGNGQLSNPAGIAVISSGNLFVADNSNNRVEEFSSSGSYITAFGSLGSGPGQFFAPSGLAFDNSGDLFVVDSGNNRIEEFSTTPEPGSLAVLVGVGIAGSIALRRRRRNRRSTMTPPTVLLADQIGHKPCHFTIPSQQHSRNGHKFLCILSTCLDQTCFCLERACGSLVRLARSVSSGPAPEGRDGVCS